MKKIFSFLVALVLSPFFFPSCASAPDTGLAEIDPVGLSMSEQWDSGRIVVDSQDGALIVIGVANRQAQRWGNEILLAEIEIARDDAARKVAMFHGVTGSVESHHRQGRGFFDFIMESHINLESTVVDHTPFIERLTFDPDRDVAVFERGTLVRFRYTAGVSRTGFTSTVDANGRPGWINNLNFDLAGYTAAVGFSQNQVWLQDTVLRATQATAARLIKGIDTIIDTSTVQEGGQTFTYITSSSSGVLNDFRIIEFWVDPRNMSVYALGIARFAE